MSPFTATFHDYRDAVRRFSPPARRFLLATFLTWMAHGVSSVLFNLYLVEGGFHLESVGPIIALNGAGLIVAALPAGVAAERWGRRRCLVLGAGIEGLGMLVRSLGLAHGLIAVTTFGTGVGQALFAISAAPFITEHSTPRERTHLFSAFFAVELLAAMVGSALGGWLPSLLAHLPPGFRPTLLESYRVTLVLGALIALVGVVPMATLRGLRETVFTRSREAMDPAVLRKLWPIGIQALVIGAGAGLVVPFMNIYFLNRFQCSSAQIGSFFAVGQITTAVAGVLGPAIALRFGKLRTATVFQLLSLPFLVTLGAEKHLEIAVVSFWLRATFMQTGTPLLTTFVMETLPAQIRARSVSLVNLLWNVGWSASSALSTVVIHRFGYDKPFYITAVLYAGAAVFFYLSFRGTPELPREDPRLSEEAKGLRGEGPGTE
jgi:MFS family permease